MRIKALHFIKYLKFIPITVYVNVRLKSALNRKQPYFPLIVTSRLRFLCDSSACVIAKSGCYLRLGYGSGGIAVFEYTGINIELYELAIMKLNGVSIIGFGSSICIYPKGVLEIGDNTYMAGNTTIKCVKGIKIGSGCSISWNVTFIDSDFHAWGVHGLGKDITQEITIEDHVWIGNNVIILKGVTIGSGSIIGAGSVVTTSVPKNTLVAGNPARIIHKEVNW